MEYTTLIPEIKEPKEEEEALTTSLYQALQQIEDGRAARGKQYELAALPLLLVLAKLAGMKSLLGASPTSKNAYVRACSSFGNACHVPIPIAMLLHIWTASK